MHLIGRLALSDKDVTNSDTDPKKKLNVIFTYGIVM